MFTRTGIAIYGALIFLAIACDTTPPKKEPPKKQEPVEQDNTALIERDSLRFQKPTIRWERLMSEGSDFYTPEDIDASNKLLDKYLADISVAQDTAVIWKAVEEVVKGFDKLSVRSNFIETGEREELAEFIQHAAEVYGLKYDGDITEKWRMEW